MVDGAGPRTRSILVYVPEWLGCGTVATALRHGKRYSHNRCAQRLQCAQSAVHSHVLNRRACSEGSSVKNSIAPSRRRKRGSALWRSPGWQIRVVSRRRGRRRRRGGRVVWRTSPQSHSLRLSRRLFRRRRRVGEGLVYSTTRHGNCMLVCCSPPSTSLRLSPPS